MKKLKLGFTDTNDHIAQFFYFNLKQRYDIEIDNEKPDYLIFGDENFGTINKSFSKSDCIKIFYTGENRRPENYDCHYAITFDHNFSKWHYRLPLFIIYMWALEHIHNTSYKYAYILAPTVKEKNRFCSFVVSNPNCAERNSFFTKLNEIKPVDSAGQFMNNTGIRLNGEQAKIDFLSERKFNICFEPYSHPGYVTEKILHAFYAGTVPIYWGSPTVTLDFNPRAFINAANFRNEEELIKHVMLLDTNEDAYNFMVNSSKFLFNIPPSYYFIDNFLNWFDAIVYNKIETRDANTFIHF